MIRRLTMVAAFATMLSPLPTNAQTVLEGYFLESGGLVVMEAESIGRFPGDWKNAAASTAPNLDLANGPPSGGDFLTWEGSQQFNNPGVSVLVFPVQIANPGTYRFQWRSQTGQGTETTEHNDTWVKITGDAFFGEKNGGSVVCPRGFDPSLNDCSGGQPNGSGADGWFKVYTSSARSWRWTARTSDKDGHEIYARFDAPGLYEIRLDARSSFHLIDRMVLFRDDYGGNPLNTALPESTIVPLDDPGGDPLTVDASGQWFERRDSGTPVFMAGVGGPEGFLFETDARKQAIVDELIREEVNALYMHSIRSFEGDGYAFEDPYVVNEDVRSDVDPAVLDNWRGFLDQLDENGIISWFHIIDDTARPWGCDVPLSADAKRYIATVVNGFKDLDHLVWLAGEEFLMGRCTADEDRALMRAIAAEIRLHDPVHPIGVHHNNGQSMQFDAPDEPVIDVFAQQICGNSAVRNPDGFYASAERGDWVYVMAECHPWHLQLLHSNNRKPIRLSNWATAMAGGYVLLYNAYECQERGRLCSRDSNGDPASPSDAHDPSTAILGDLRRLREFMEASRFSELAPLAARGTGDTDWVLGNDAAGLWIAYSNDTPGAMGVSGLGDADLRLRWYDPATGTDVIQDRVGADSPFDVPAVFGEDVALFVESDGPVSPPPDPELGLSLVDAAADDVLGPLVDGGVLSIANLDFSLWSAVASPLPPGAQSVGFSLAGAITYQQTENQAPYALFGDTNGDFDGVALAPGDYEIRVRAYGGPNAGGSVLADVTVSFRMVEESAETVILESGFEGDVAPALRRR